MTDERTRHALRAIERGSSRRQLLAGMVGAAALAACTGRDVTAPTVAPPPSAATPTGANTPAAAAPAAGAATPVVNPPPAQPATAATPTAQAAAPVAAKPAGPVKRGGTLTAGIGNEAVNFDNLFNSSVSSPHFMVYDPLLFYRQDAQGKWGVAPGLVDKWEFSGTSGVLKLREGVKFHDGSDWNAEVCKWNLDRMVKDPKSLARGALNGLDPKEPVTIVDGTTVKLNLTQPSPALVEGLTSHYVYPISKKAFEEMGAEKYARNPVGTGPFKFAEWRSGDRIILKRNEGYWGKAADGQALPYLDQLVYRLIIDDSVRLLEIRSGNIDFNEVIPGKDIATIKADQNQTYIETPWFGNAYRIVFSSKSGKFKDNLKLRQAALYAIDRDVLAKALGQGAGVASKFLLPPGALGYDETLPYYGYDLDKAKGLMKEAGFGSGLEVNFSVIQREADKTQAEILKEMWNKIGLRVNIDVLERAAWTARLFTGNGEFDVASMRNGGSAGDPDGQLRILLWSKGSFNVAHLEDKEMDTALDKAAGTYDQKERQGAYRELQKHDYDLAYYGYLWFQSNNWSYSKKLVGFPAPWSGYWDFRTAWLDK